MKKLLMGKLVRGIEGVKVQDLQPCDFCKVGKLPHGPHPLAAVDNKDSRLLDLVVVDLAVPNRPQTLGHKLYDMVIVDTLIDPPQLSLSQLELGFHLVPLS